MSLNDISDQADEIVYFFGAAQIDLAQNACDGTLNRAKYYKSSTPIVTIISYLRRFSKNRDTYVAVKDPGFCVRSNPKFLYLIAKMCYKKGAYVDLAV